MAESELYRKGAEMRRQLMGQAEVERLGRTTYGDPVMKKFLDVATETVFGALWTRPGLDLKTRALICVISDTCRDASRNWPCICAWHCVRGGLRTS
jgi:4-carboxymuconolactone decarboxylase